MGRIRYPGWDPDEDDLKDYAELHIKYEVVTLHGQLVEVGRGRYSGTVTAPVGLALMEAVLVHIRLLDEFLGLPPVDDDVRAKHYLPGWNDTPFLAPPERDRINAQVAHLAARRPVAGPSGRPKYSLNGLGRRCGLALLDFERQLRADAAHRYRVAYLIEAFDAARLLAGRTRAASLGTTPTTVETST